MLSHDKNNESTIVKSVLSGDLDAVKISLVQGESPNEASGTPIIIHAALLPSLEIFKLLLNYGAVLPSNFLEEVISWELGDWILSSDEEIYDFTEIIQMLRGTNAWISFNERLKLVKQLEGYNLGSVKEALLPELY